MSFDNGHDSVVSLVGGAGELERDPDLGGCEADSRSAGRSLSKSVVVLDEGEPLRFGSFLRGTESENSSSTSESDESESLSESLSESTGGATIPL